ncbi:hypothetical protein C807_02153 [Lachnospiraceae bacterium 28-4]|nr:hypothetical protein C807_02153 [Lachnospiraceae bacterium 28-4]
MSHSDASPLADGFGRREGGFSGCYAKSAILLMKWFISQGKIAMDGNVIKLGFVIPK